MCMVYKYKSELHYWWELSNVKNTRINPLNIEKRSFDLDLRSL